MNILYTNFHRKHGGGHTTYILSLLKNKEHNKFVACPPTSLLYSILERQGYERLIPLDFPARLKHFGQIAKNALSLRRIIGERNIDIVHTNGSGDNRMALYAALLPGRKFKVVYTKHNTIRIKNPVSRLRFKWFNSAVIFVCDLIERLGLDKDFPRFHVVGNGIDLEHWKKREAPQTGPRIRLISNAGAARHKGWHHLIEAIAGLDEDEKKRLTVVMLARYEEEMAKELAEAGTVCDFHFPGFFEDARPELEKADVGFLLSYREACSFAHMEMMGMGLPVITSDFPTLAAAVDPGCGWVTKTKDAKSIRAVLKKILALPPAELEGMKMAARKRAEADFSIAAMISRTNDIYEKIWPVRDACRGAD